MSQTTVKKLNQKTHVKTSNKKLRNSLFCQFEHVIKNLLIKKPISFLFEDQLKKSIF